MTKIEINFDCPFTKEQVQASFTDQELQNPVTAASVRERLRNIDRYQASLNH